MFKFEINILEYAYLGGTNLQQTKNFSVSFVTSETCFI